MWVWRFVEQLDDSNAHANFIYGQTSCQVPELHNGHSWPQEHRILKTSSFWVILRVWRKSNVFQLISTPKNSYVGIFVYTDIDICKWKLCGKRIATDGVFFFCILLVLPWVSCWKKKISKNGIFKSKFNPVQVSSWWFLCEWDEARGFRLTMSIAGWPKLCLAAIWICDPLLLPQPPSITVWGTERNAWKLFGRKGQRSVCVCVCVCVREREIQQPLIMSRSTR